MKFWVRKNKQENIVMELNSEITCPECQHKAMEVMPTTSCQYFYVCANCEKVLKPINNDCCVYCSYGTVPCPPIQESGGKSDCCK